MSASLETIYVGSRPGVNLTTRTMPTPPATKGDLADPSTIHVDLESPLGALTEYDYPASGTITKLSLGLWRFIFPFDADVPGTWWVYVKTTGFAIATASEISIKVRGTHALH